MVYRGLAFIIFKISPFGMYRDTELVPGYALLKEDPPNLDITTILSK